MWTPTHVQMTIHRAKNLIPKGKNGTNDAYVTITLGKEKYQTSVKEKAEGPEWHEECDLPIPSMESCLVLNCFHRNLLGMDEFLGHVSIPLEQFQIYERPKSRWYALKNKPGVKKKDKYRGEIEVRVLFTVKNVVKRDRRMSLQPSSIGDKIQFKMERRKSKDVSSDLEESVSQFMKMKAHDSLTSTKSSPAKLEKKKHSISHEILATTPSFDQTNTRQHDSDNSSVDSRNSVSSNAPSTDCSTGNTTPNKQIAPPKPPRTSMKDKSPELTEKLPKLDSNLDSSFSLSKLQGSPKQYRSRENIAESDSESIPESSEIKKPSDIQTADQGLATQTIEENTETLANAEKALSSKSLDQSQEEDDYFSRTNSFRQAISRGSLRRSGGKRNKTQSDIQSSPLLTGVRRSYTDSNPSIDTLPEETSTPATTPNSDRQQTGSHRDLSHVTHSNQQLDHAGLTDGKDKHTLKSRSSSHLESGQIYNVDNTSPRLRVKLSKQDPSRRHTLGVDGTVLSHVATHGIQQTIEDVQRIEQERIQQVLPNEVLDRYKHFTREDLIKTVLSQKKELDEKTAYTKDLEQYIDNLLVRVIEVQPRILQNPFPNSPARRTQQTISSGVQLGVNLGGHNPPHRQVNQAHPNYPPPAYTNNVIITQNNNRNLVQQQQQQQQNHSSNNRSRISPPKVIKAGQNNKKEKKSNNPFKKFLKN